MIDPCQPATAKFKLQADVGSSLIASGGNKITTSTSYLLFRYPTITYVAEYSECSSLTSSSSNYVDKILDHNGVNEQVIGFDFANAMEIVTGVSIYASGTTYRYIYVKVDQASYNGLGAQSQEFKIQLSFDLTPTVSNTEYPSDKITVSHEFTLTIEDDVCSNGAFPSSLPVIDGLKTHDLGEMYVI